MDGQLPDSQPTKPADDQRSERQVDEYEAASQATAQEDEYDEYERHAKPYRRGHTVRTLLIVLAAVVVLAGIGFGGYWLFLRKDDASSNKTDQTSSQQRAAEAAPQITDQTKHHASTNFTLELDYPDNWEITDTAGSGKLIAQSPEMNLKKAGGQTITGRVVLTIRDKQQALPEFDKGNAVAARESEKINYTKPSSAQRGSTYLSFLHYASSTTVSTGIDGIYITGDTGYQAEQAIPKADFTPVDPVISVTFISSDKSFTLDSSIWQDAAFAGPIKAMLQSLTIT